MKTCTNCGQSKNVTEFYKVSKSSDKLRSQCKICLNNKCHKYHSDNKETISKNAKQYRDKNKPHRKASVIQYRRDNAQKKAEYDRQYRKKNADKIAQYKRDWEKRNSNDPIFKIKRNLRRRVHHVLKDGYKSASTFELIGCTAEEFKLHIESLWEDGMSWDNYGPDGWHIDHIKPCHEFDLTIPEQQRICFHYTNQRPLWASENLSRERPALRLNGEQ